MKMKPKGDLPVGALRKTPSLRNKFPHTTEDWMRGKKLDDGAEGLWRIHDKLYDFSKFLDNHPGGKFWLEVSKGTDITEAFESHHISDKAEKLLGKYEIRKAKTPRLSLLTFHPDGFYNTLKRKIRQANMIDFMGSTWQSRLILDIFLVGYLVTSILAASSSLFWSLAAGIFLEMLTVAAHNFFHMRDNIRMKYFNFSLLSYREWRVTHSLSHHSYANTYLDLEISMFEPFFQFLPKEEKTILTRIFSWISSPVVFTVIFFMQFFKRNVMVILGKQEIHFDDYLGLTVPLLVWFVTGKSNYNILISWLLTLVFGSFLFGLIGLTAAHHHPDIYHEGDYLGKDKDFGLFQLAAVRDRKEINNSFFFTMITFGAHALHHLFPTIDHHKLPALTPYFLETCKEFNINFQLTTTGNLVIGMYQQLGRNYTNSKLLIQKIKGS